jgi:uncharacterized protein with PQ loop repeat
LLETLVGWSIEYQKWGYNLLSCTAIATLFFSVLQGSMTFIQGGKIREMKSALSVNVGFFGFRLWTFTSILIYGYMAHSLALLVNGFIQMSAQAFVMLQLRRHKKDGSRTDWRIAKWSAVIVPCTLLSGGNAGLVSVIAVATLIPLFRQNVELHKNEKVGALSGKLVASLNAASLFWTAYGFIVRDPVLMVFAPTAAALYLALGVQYIRYRNN